MDRKRQHCRAVTSFPLMVKGKAWLGIKDPPAGEGQVGQKTPLWQRRDGVDRKKLTEWIEKNSLLGAKEGRGGKSYHSDRYLTIQGFNSGMSTSIVSHRLSGSMV